jgi:hypothetical protein
MTDAQLNLAHRLVSELSMYVKALDQNNIGNGSMIACLRNAASLLQIMVDEAELAQAKELATELMERRRDNPSP